MWPVPLWRYYLSWKYYPTSSPQGSNHWRFRNIGLKWHAMVCTLPDGGIYFLGCGRLARYTSGPPFLTLWIAQTKRPCDGISFSPLRLVGSCGPYSQSGEHAPSGIQSLNQHTGKLIAKEYKTRNGVVVLFGGGLWFAWVDKNHLFSLFKLQKYEKVVV